MSRSRVISRKSRGWPNSFWISRNRGSFEKAAHELEQRRQRLVRLHTFIEDGHRYWAGIARESDRAHRFWVSSDLDSFQREAEQLCGDTGRRLVAVEFLD